MAVLATGLEQARPPSVELAAYISRSLPVVFGGCWYGERLRVLLAGPLGAVWGRVSCAVANATQSYLLCSPRKKPGVQVGVHAGPGFVPCGCCVDVIVFVVRPPEWAVILLAGFNNR